jgi:polyisoprenoid-binding protein YceI
VYVTAEAAPEEFQRTRDDGLTAVRTAELQVPVRSIDCGIGMQNRHLFETLGATAHPEIFFALNGYSVDRSANIPRVRIQGRLRIAGVERDVILYGIVFRDPGGDWVLRGERPINVRDFGVKPPRRFFGLLRVRDEITVHFDVAVRPLIDPVGVLIGSLQ